MYAEKKGTKMTLLQYKVKDDDASRFKYWEYYNILVRKEKIMAGKAI
jgi:hypothetical protein